MTRRVADGTIDVSPDKPGHIAVPVTWGRYRLEVTSADPQGPETTFGFDSGWYAEASADTPDLLEIALDKPEYKPGDSMTVAVTARSAGEVTLAVIGDKLLANHHGRCRSRHRQAAAHRRRRLGHRRLCARHACGVRSTLTRSACRAAPSALPGSPSTRRRTRSAWRMDLPDRIRPRDDAPRADQARRAHPRRRGAGRGVGGRCRHPQSHQLQGAGAGRTIISASASSRPRCATFTAS